MPADIPYTTAFDHSLAVDKWGRAHIGVVVGYAPGRYQITSGIDSMNNVYDIVVCPLSNPIVNAAIHMGTLKTFRGTWGGVTSDNRVYISRNTTGNKIFLTWNDTKIDGEPDNQNPDVYARGLDVVAKKLTWPDPGSDASNLTFLSDLTQEAYFQCTSPIVFTEANKFTLPVCLQWFSNPADDTRFKYIPDFSFLQSDFTENSGYFCSDPWTAPEKSEILAMNVSPNPAQNRFNTGFSLDEPADVTLEMTDLTGQRVLQTQNKNLGAGSHELETQIDQLKSGIYFVALRAGDRQEVKKIMISR